MVLGSDARPILASGDVVADRGAMRRFVTNYDLSHRLVETPEGLQQLVIGDTDWPFPIPLVRVQTRWSFATETGLTEVLARRVGQNELDAIQVCLTYVQAQQEYRDLNPDGDAVAHYATRLFSSSGTHDGLYWPAEEGKPESPLGPAVAGPAREGYVPTPGKARPYHGYFYRILTRQGPHAEGGAADFMVQGRMTGGFALVAYPATYRNSGVMTFIVNQAGAIFQKDLGPDTSVKAKAMRRFDPDDSWKPTGP